MTSGVTRRIAIVDLAHGGAGVGRVVDSDSAETSGIVWFVQGALPGEVVDAEPEHQSSRYVRARCVRVIEPSAARVEPTCVYAQTCGGCDWQHVEPLAQAGLKQQIVAGQLRRLSMPAIDVRASPRALGYRRRARLHYEQAPGGLPLRLGFRAPRSKEIVDVETCVVLDAALQVAFPRLRELAPWLAPAGEMHLVSDGHRVVVGLPGVPPSTQAVAALDRVLDSYLVGIELRGGRERARIGRTRLRLDADPRAPLVGPFDFAQAQTDQNDALIEAVGEGAGTGESCLELFAGAGNLTRVLLGRFSTVVCVEAERDAVRQLRRMAKEHGRGMQVAPGKAATVLARLAAAQRNVDIAVLDPPRAGLGEAAMATLCSLTKRRIVYVSCDAATLARDLAVAETHGFCVSQVCVFDLMPMTSHVEVVALLDRHDRAGQPHRDTTERV